MDIRMPVMDGVKATKAVKELRPETKVIILTTFNEDEYIFEGLQNGADGYILKDVKPDEIINGIKSVYLGNSLLQPEVAKKVVKEFTSLKKEFPSLKVIQNTSNIKALTAREMEIAFLIAQGKSNKEISRILYITDGTVRNHITSLLNKLGCRDRTQVALRFNNIL